MDVGTAVAGAWSSGISVYAVAALLGIAGRLDWVDSPDFLQQPWVIAVAVALAVVELVADKISFLDSAWDAVHTVIRPVAGALLLMSSDASAGTGGLAIGGAALALSAHAAKASTRLLVNTSPEPVSNVVVSLAEDGVVAALMTLALTVPEVALALTVVLALACLGVVYVVYRTARRLGGGRRATRPG